MAFPACEFCARRFDPDEDEYSTISDIAICGICGVKLWIRGALARHVPALREELAKLEAKVFANDANAKGCRT